MGKKAAFGFDRARALVAQETARIMVEQGIRDFRVAKTKAAERLGLTERGALPGNREIEQALGDHLQLFGRDSHGHLLKVLRRAALSAMEMLAPFGPRLVGPVLSGTAADSLTNFLPMHIPLFRVTLHTLSITSAYHPRPIISLSTLSSNLIACRIKIIRSKP